MIPLIPIIFGGAAVVLAKAVYDVVHEEATESTTPTVDPEALRKKRERERSKKDFLKERERVLMNFSERHDLGLKRAEIQKLDTTGDPHGEILASVVERKAKEIRRASSAELKERRAVTNLLTHINELRYSVDEETLRLEDALNEDD